MLVLSRQLSEKILFPELGIEIELLRINRKSARIGITAPRSIHVVRAELDNIDKYQRRETDVDVSATDQLNIADIQGQLDTANLALHLAQNQLKFDRLEHAEDTLDQALEAMEKLEQMLSKHPEWKQSHAASQSVTEKAVSQKTNLDRSDQEAGQGNRTSQVNEATTGYAIGKQTAWVVVEPEDATEVASAIESLEANNFDVVAMSTKEMLLELGQAPPTMLLIQTPLEVAAETNDTGVFETENFLAENEPIVLPGIASLQCQGTQEFAGCAMTVWR